MQVRMEETKKYLINDEEEAELFIQSEKARIEEEGGQVIDYKLTVKETKESTFVVLTIKARFLTLPEAKESIGV